MMRREVAASVHDMDVEVQRRVRLAVLSKNRQCPELRFGHTLNT